MLLIIQALARRLEAAAEAKIIKVESSGLDVRSVADSIAGMHNGDDVVIAAPTVRVRFSMVRPYCAHLRLLCACCMSVSAEIAASMSDSARNACRLCARYTSWRYTPWTAQTASHAWGF